MLQKPFTWLSLLVMVILMTLAVFENHPPTATAAAISNTEGVDSQGNQAQVMIYVPLTYSHIELTKLSPVNGRTGEPLSVTLDWNDDRFANGYEYCYDTSDDHACSNWISSGAASQATISGLVNGTMYFWQVRAIYPAGPSYANGDPKAFWLFTTQSSAAVNHEMVRIPAGEFQMGCDEQNAAWDCDSVMVLHERPLHKVYLDEYWIDKYEVTNAQYAECVAAGVCTPPFTNASLTRSAYYDNPTYANYPVIAVSWFDASTYCAWSGRRLPTEAEWEKAARGPNDTRIWPWGDQPPDCNLANSKGRSFYDEPCVGDTTAVGSYPAGASPYGVMDMAGNVWEWVYDFFYWEYYVYSPASNPFGPLFGSDRGMRGGSLLDEWVYLRSNDRGASDPKLYSYNVGFRCAEAPGE